MLPRTAILSALAASLVCIPSFAKDAAFTVGSAAAEPGQKASGFIQVAAAADPGTNIPVVVVHGKRPGPVLAVVAGAHGTEYASIVAVERLIGLLDASQVSGKVILVPLVNLASFEQKVPHLNPVDGKNMNRMYPGKPDGTQTERASWLITQQVVEQSDYLIDLHGGDLDESLRPYSYWIKAGRERQDEVSREMALAFGLDHVIISADRPKDPAASRYLDNTAATRGKPAIVVEAGHAGTVEPDDVEALVRGCLSVMRHLKMLEGAPQPVDHPVWIDRLANITSEQTGIFYPLVRRGTYVEAGMKLGYVTDYFGRIVYEARPSVGGVVLYICAVPSMRKGDTIASIGVVAAKAP